MADFNGADINAMRQDAIRRVREMQSRSQSYTSRGSQEAAKTQDFSQRHGAPPLNNKGAPYQSAPNQSCINNNRRGSPDIRGCPEAQAQKGGPLSGILNQFFPGIGGKLDEDRIILVVLLILLAREGADLKLLLALGYLIM